jgi:hypothetical protein
MVSSEHGFVQRMSRSIVRIGLSTIHKYRKGQTAHRANEFAATDFDLAIFHQHICPQERVAEFQFTFDCDAENRSGGRVQPK